MIYDSPIFKKCPALAALSSIKEPQPEHIRACLMELALYISKLEKNLKDGQMGDRATVGCATPR